MQIGEIALIPATGGLFSVELVCVSLQYPLLLLFSFKAFQWGLTAGFKTYVPVSAEDEEKVEAKKVLLWDRKTEGGFPGMLGCSIGAGE